MKVLLILPPMTQINSPYPSTAYLTAYLQSRNFAVDQRDLSLDFIERVFSRDGLEKIFEIVKKIRQKPSTCQFFAEHFATYHACIDDVMRFLRGQDQTLSLRISSRHMLPEGPRFAPLHDHAELLECFGTMGTLDKAKYLASLFLDDISDVVRLGVDERFEFSRYAEHLASSQPSFTPLQNSLQKRTILDTWIEEILQKYLVETKPDVVGLSVPFPGNLYGALRVGQYLKEHHPEIKIVLGGGWVNTELRHLEDPRLFDYIDFLCFDDGERPLECVLEFLTGRREKEKLFRTWVRENGKLTKISDPHERDVLFKDTSAPTFRGLPLERYISMIELPNPMHRMWSDLRWNKMILAHGCYWKKCTFCDVSLHYINRYEPKKAEVIVDQIEKVIAETGTTGFHFVDEAAPPAVLKQMAEELIRRRVNITWWGNIRFDAFFTPTVTELLARSGCIAVTGGLEVASPRVLKLINKGVSIEQVAQVTHAFAHAGIFVHAYLMYGFPTQTTQETVDSLEVVRQLFKNNCLQSAHWHKFLVTQHSPVGLEPDKYKIKLKPQKKPAEGLFAQYEIPFVDSTSTPTDELGTGLHKAVYNYMHDIGLNNDLQAWFDIKIPKTKIKKSLIQSYIRW